MSNERYWIFHEWVRSNYTLESGYTKGTWDTLALAYLFYEDDEYYLQFENKTKSDNEIDLHIGESTYDMPLVAWLLKNAPLYHNRKNDREGSNRKIRPPFAIDRRIAIAPPIATEILEDTAQSQQTFKHRMGIQARYRAIQMNYRVKGINIYPK